MIRHARIAVVILSALTWMTFIALGQLPEYESNVHTSQDSSCVFLGNPCVTCSSEFTGCERKPNPAFTPWGVTSGSCGSGLTGQSCTDGSFNCGRMFICGTMEEVGSCGWTNYCN